MTTPPIIAFQSSVAEWGQLLQYGPAGLVSAALLWGLKLVIDFQREKAKINLDQTGSLIAGIQKRDQSHEAALVKIAESLDQVTVKLTTSMDKVAERLDNHRIAIIDIRTEQEKSNILVSALARIIQTQDGKRLTEREYRELIRSIIEEHGGAK